MRKTDIEKLGDNDLKLRYYLGGLKSMNNDGNIPCNYWGCEINCSCSAVCDDENLTKVKDFIKKHDITNERFLKLSYDYLRSSIMKYKGSYTPLFIELEEVLKPYQLIHNEQGKIQDDDFREKELEELVNDDIIIEFISKHNLDKTDIIALSKTSINYNFHRLYCVPDDDFFDTIYNLIDSYGLYVSKDKLDEYKKIYHDNQENASTIIAAKEAQNKYLELMKKLIIRQPDLANDMINFELSELGIKLPQNNGFHKVLTKLFKRGN